MGAIVKWFYHPPQPSDLPTGGLSGAIIQRIQGVIQLAYASGFKDGFYAGVVVVLTIFVLALLIRRDRGNAKA
jgi:hypothetical protein